jgi:transposase
LGITWPLPDEMDDARLEEQLYPKSKTTQHKTLPDMEWIHRELKRKSVTLQLLWLEYKANHPDGIQYSQFCRLHRALRLSPGITLFMHSSMEFV